MLTLCQYCFQLSNTNTNDSKYSLNVSLRQRNKVKINLFLSLNSDKNQGWSLLKKKLERNLCYQNLLIIDGRYQFTNRNIAPSLNIPRGGSKYISRLDKAYVEINCVFGLKWRYYGSKRDILDYWGTLISWFIILLYHTKG